MATLREPGYLNDTSKYSTLNSALAVPLEGLKGVVGVVALYHAEKTSSPPTTADSAGGKFKMALAIENAMKYEQAESSAVTDYLTGLPNARSLFLHLDGKWRRCKRHNKTLTVMVATWMASSRSTIALDTWKGIAYCGYLRTP